MQHGETMLQAIELARLSPAPAVPRERRPAAPGGHTGLEAVTVPGGPCELGAPDDRFAYDNERPRHRTDVREFRIGRTPITNATYLHFVEGGGYERRTWWSDEAWAWKEEYDITHPEGWARGPTGEWRRWTMDGWAPLDPDEPVVHVSWFEADALARAHGARLPTEAEWEKAATWDQETGAARDLPWGDDPDHRGRANLDHALLGPAPAGAYPDGASPCGALGMLGDAWEWTASDFRGYDGFTAHPYREYSEVFFGDEYKVLRGGAWATRARVATPTFRNWDLPQRRQIFSGVRLAWDA
jgi:iron(II)-dependent oxidoreductase